MPILSLRSTQVTIVQSTTETGNIDTQEQSLSCLQNAIQLQGSIGSRIHYMLHTNYFINRNLIAWHPIYMCISVLILFFFYSTNVKHVYTLISHSKKQQCLRDLNKYIHTYIMIILALSFRCSDSAHNIKKKNHKCHQFLQYFILYQL